VRSWSTAFVVAACVASAASADDSKPAAPPPAKPPATDCAPDCGPDVKIEVVAKGEGREAQDGDVALAHFTMAIASNGKVVADTRKAEEPQALPIGWPGYLLPGMEKVVSKMRLGDHFKVDLPWRLAFGERGYPGQIPPKSDLKLDIELVGFLELKKEILASGKGEPPARFDMILVHYATSFADGTKFDSSRERDEPVMLPAGAGRVFQGWDLTMLKLKIGDHWKVTVPWQLAYGAHGAPPKIPPKSDIVLDIERLPMPEVKSEVIATGKGPLCTAGQTITVHYTGMLMDGTKFESSRDRDQPFQFALGAHPPQVIVGWEQAVATMHVGDRRKVTIPWLLAYGAAGNPPGIPAKADLVFDIEVLDAK